MRNPLPRNRTRASEHQGAAENSQDKWRVENREGFAAFVSQVEDVVPARVARIEKDGSCRISPLKPREVSHFNPGMTGDALPYYCYRAVPTEVSVEFMHCSRAGAPAISSLAPH